MRDPSPARQAGVAPGDEIVAMNGRVPRDVIEYQLLADEELVELDLLRGGVEVSATVDKRPGESLGIEVSSALFDRVRTCDNHCEFCFIYQLPKGMRRSLYLKDDDYRLSFLYGNFTTLTRFTEADLERVVTERLSPLFVSIHAFDPEVRGRMLNNRRGATSLRWLRALLDHGIEVHGQVVVCPGVNDGEVLEDTFAAAVEGYPELATIAAVPLGVSRYSTAPAMRPHTAVEAGAVLDLVGEWQELCLQALGRRLVFAADEFYLLAGRPFPRPDHYEGFAQHENGVGIATAFETSFYGDSSMSIGVRPGFFAWVDGAPAEGYRAQRLASAAPRSGAPARGTPVAVVTGEYGASIIGRLLSGVGRDDVRVVAVRNDYFGGNIAAAGLMTGSDVARALRGQPAGHRYLLPDVCLSEGRFLDGLGLEDLPRPVEVVASDGMSLRMALDPQPGAAAESPARAAGAR